MSMEVNNGYYAYRASYTSESKSINLADFDHNKRYTSLEEFNNDLLALGKKLEVQYGEITRGSGVNSIEDLKREIGQLFPEYTMVSGKPRDVVEGKNLLYIDDGNLQKMLKDPAYKCKIYGLMKRELLERCVCEGIAGELPFLSFFLATLSVGEKP